MHPVPNADLLRDGRNRSHYVSNCLASLLRARNMSYHVPALEVNRTKMIYFTLEFYKVSKRT